MRCNAFSRIVSHKKGVVIKWGSQKCTISLFMAKVKKKGWGGNSRDYDDHFIYSLVPYGGNFSDYAD